MTGEKSKVKETSGLSGVAGESALSFVNPVKVAPSIGAAFALQGIRKAAPFYHTSPGCTFLSKVLLTQHLHEPVSIQGTDMKETGLVYGGQSELIQKVTELARKQNPELIAVISASTSQIRGDDFHHTFQVLKEQERLSHIVMIEAPDYAGGFAEGFSAAITALVRRFAVPGESIRKNINIFPAPYMNAGDIDEIKKIVSLFDLNPVVIPDLSVSVDGSDTGYHQMSTEGTTVEDLVRAGRAGASLAFGRSMSAPARFLHEAFEVPFQALPSLSGVRATDALVRFLMNYSGQKKVSSVLKRERARLVDLMVDAHLHMASHRVHLALEYDHALAVKTAMEEWGVQVERVVVPPVPGKENRAAFPCETGGLYLLEQEYHLTSGQKPLPDLLISNSHGRALAGKYNLPFIPVGFPVYDYYGAALAGRCGYAGTTRFFIETANQWKHTRREK